MIGGRVLNRLYEGSTFGEICSLIAVLKTEQPLKLVVWSMEQSSHWTEGCSGIWFMMR